jgi:hypothetical protein
VTYSKTIKKTTSHRDNVMRYIGMSTKLGNIFVGNLRLYRKSATLRRKLVAIALRFGKRARLSHLRQSVIKTYTSQHDTPLEPNKGNE